MPTLTYTSGNAIKEYKLLVIGQGEIEQTARYALSIAIHKAKIYTSGAASEGLRLLQQHSFDCVLLNFSLPDMNCLEVLESINFLHRTTPVVVITATENAPLTEQALQLGAAECLPISALTPESTPHFIRNAIRLKQAEVERLRTGEKLRSSEEQLEFLVSNTPTAFWNIDAKGNFKFASGMGFEQIGIHPEDIIGNNFYDVFKAYPRIVGRFKRTLSGEVVQAVDETNGLFFKSHYVPVYDEQGHITGVTGFAVDITERVKNERELLKAKEVAENSSRIKEQFLANISHEIRTPMNGIIGLANVLRKTELEPEQQKYLNAIRKSADNLMQIINDLLDFSKISSNQFAFEEVQFNLAELVQDIVDLMDNKAREKQNQLTTHIGDDVPLQVNGDPLRLRQVILNLVSNATKFTQNGKIKILVNALEEHAETIVLEFTVEDTGIGIPPEKHKAVFESFNQGSNDTTRKYGGTGLGLTISKNIVEMQGGTISVRSQPQAGSAFTFSIPFKKVHNPEQLAAESAIEEEEETFLNKLSGIKVLLAEDNEINQLLLTTILANWGVETDVVTNGLDALEKAFSKPYDLILMDMQMPVLDGYEAIEQLRASACVNASLPVISLTAHAAHDEIKKCLASGATAYLSKPFDTNDLFKTIVKLINQEGKYKGASVNMKALRGMAGNNTSFILEILEMYIESTPGAVAKLHELIESDKLEEARVALSELYDSISVLSAKPLQFTFERMASALHVKNTKLLQRNAAQAIVECNELIELLQQEHRNASEAE
ncbi:PAS domain S-box-containing protein [Pontibacter aydingkolensis]|uniref:histidine kinase n=1 Tax=Pontibacter aydingkolensis TaxID=1911536 RepID=A0ABS7CVP1_9BACT|nr:response regulator [Pontibacter aydingkolensis]MBW7467897.1 response regulator [Pontibacter aydingkolensis]